MSGIPIHTSDPINPAKATAVTPQTSSSSSHLQSSSSQPTASTTASHGYPTARPGQGVPTPTKTAKLASGSAPAPPQPGAVPEPAPPAVTARAVLPPPPKAGERPLPPEAYVVRHSTTAPPVTVPPPPYPAQMSQTLSDNPAYGVPPSSTTSTTTRPSFASNPDLSHHLPPKSSLEHPPGYVQNQHATDLTAEQRSAIEQEEAMNRSHAGPLLGETGSGTATGMWESAKVFAGQVGQKAGELHTDIWDKINGGK